MSYPYNNEKSGIEPLKGSKTIKSEQDLKASMMNDMTNDLGKIYDELGASWANEICDKLIRAGWRKL